MVMGFVGEERIVSFVGVEFMAIHVVASVGVLIKSAYSSKTRSLQLRLLRLGFGWWARGVAC